MATSNQIAPGMTLNIKGKLYRVESSVKVTLKKGTPFIKTKLREMTGGELVEKNFKLNQTVTDVSLEERSLEFLYPEGKDYLFLDIVKLEPVLVSSPIIGPKVHYLKEGTEVKGSFYGETIFSIELPQFLELMISKVETSKDASGQSQGIATLETGAKLAVLPFIEVGDVIKVDTTTGEFIQRV